MKSLYSFLSRVNSASNVKLSASAATNPTENLLKKFILRTAGVVALLLVFGGSVWGQTAGFNNTYAILSINGAANAYYDLNAATANTDFNGANLGTFNPASNSLTLKGAEHNVWKCGGCDLTSTKLNYRIYSTTGTAGTFVQMNVPYTSTVANGCGGADQVWSVTGNSVNVLSGLAPGTYYLEVFSDATVTCSGGTVYASNFSANYKATFTVTGTNYVTTNNSSGLASSYATLAAAITALNAATITSPVVITLYGNETAPSAGYTVTKSGTAANTITIQGNGAANTIVTAFGGQTSGVKTDAVFKIIGADYITLQNMKIQENSANTTTAVANNNMTEFGVGLFLTSATDGAQNNIVQNCTISLGSAYQNAIGIFSTSSSSSTNGALAATSTAGTNSNNKFYGNTISNVAYGMYFICEPITSSINEAGIDVGGTALSTGNTITFGNATTSDITLTRFSATNPAGIAFRNGIGGNIRFNTITSNSLNYIQTNGLYGINLISGGTAPTSTYSIIVSDNTINLTNNGTTAIKGVDFGGGNSTATVVSSNNTITITQNAAAATSAQIWGVLAGYSNLSSTINSNTITITQSNTGTGASSGQVAGIGNYPGATVTSSTQTANSNIITFKQNAPTSTGTYTNGMVYIFANSSTNLFSVGTGTISSNQFLTTGSTIRTTGTVYGIYHDYTYATSLTMNNNTFTWDRTVSGSTYGTYATTSGSSIAVNVTNNTFSLTGSVSGGTTYTVFNEQDGSSGTATTKTVTGNTVSINTPSLLTSVSLVVFDYAKGSVSNNSFTVTSAGSINGSTIGSVSPGVWTFNNNTYSLSSSGVSPTITGILLAYASGHTISNNTFNTLSASAASTNAPTISAISITSATTTTANSIFGNRILNSSTGASTGSSTITGINIGGGGTNLVYQNKITDLGTASSGSLTIVSGIKLGAGTTNTVYNNLVGNLTASASTNSDAIRAINITSTTASSTQNIYYNTIYLSGTSSGATFGGSGIFHTTSTTATTSSLDLRNNNIVNAMTPKGAALAVAYRRSSTTLTNYPATANNNNFFGTSGLFTDGINTYSTLTTYKTAMSTRDQVSQSVNPTFLSTTGSSANFLHVDGTTNTTGIEGGAQVIATYTTDYDGDSRNGTAPDIGADEFISYTQCASYTSPINGAIDQLQTGVTLTWSAAANASGYDVYFDQNASPTTLVSSNQAGTTYATGALSASTTYYWKIVPRNSAGVASSCATWSFQTQAATPTLSTNPSSPTAVAFGNQCQNVLSSAQTFTMTGLNLTETYVTIAAPSDFTVSEDNITFSSSMNVNHTSGSFSNKTIYVKFTPTGLTSYASTITISGGGLSSPVSVALTGTGVNSLAGLSYSASSGIYCTGTAITALNAALGTTGGTVTYSIFPALPTGLSINMSTGQITGTPTAAAASTSYTITASNGCSSTTATVNITVYTALSALTYTTTSASYCVNQAITANSVTSITGGGTITYSISPALPAGLNLDLSTGQITGTPTAVTASASYTVTATNGTCSATRALTIAVVNTAATATSGSASSVTTTGATVAGTFVANCQTITSYGIEYSTTSGFANGAGTQVASTNQSAGSYTSSLTGLTSGTTYYYKAYAVYSGTTVYGTQSSFTTTCSTASLPWSENFDAIPSIGSAILPNCWGNTTGTYPFVSANASYTTYNDPKSAPNYMTIRYSNTTASYLWTPGFSLTSGQSVDISFWYAGDGLSGWTGDIVSNTSQNSTGVSAVGSSFIASATTSSSTYQQLIRTFIAPSTGTYYFAVKVVSTGSPWYLGFDDFSVIATPLCTTAPSAVSVSSVTNSGASASWTAPGSAPANGYEYYVTASSSTPSTSVTPTGSTGAGVTTATLSSLSAATTYYLWVRTNCNGTDKGTWTGGTSFTTQCNPLTVPWSEGFEGLTSVGTTSFPICWLEGTGTNWQSLSALTSSYNDPRTGNNYIGCSYGGTNDRIWTPGFALTAGVTYNFSTYFVGDGYASWVGDVVYNTSQSAVGETVLGASFITAGTASTSGTNYAQILRSFTAPLTGTYYFGIRISSTTTPWSVMGFDDFSLVGPCAAPSTQATSMNFTGVTVGSTTVNFSAATGSPTGYLVVRYPNGSTPTNPTNATTYVAGNTIGTGTVVGVGAGTSFTASSLSPSTIYDYYVYSYNNTSCVGPVFNTTSPLTSSQSTLGCPTYSSTISVGPTGDYPSITNLVTFMNTCPISQPTVIELQSTYVSSVETYPLTLGLANGQSATNTITVRPASGATNLSITSNNTTATLDLNGGDYWIFDGRPGGSGSLAATNLTISNTSSVTGGTAIRFINDAVSNTIRFTNISSVFGSATSGIINFSTTTGSTGNDNNTITDNNINGNSTCPIGIYSSGTTTTSTLNNSGNTISNNNIYDNFAPTINSQGVFVDAGSNSWTISGNSFYQTATRTVTATGRYVGIEINSSGDNFSISGNFIGGSAASCSGTTTYMGAAAVRYRGISLKVGTTTPSSVQGNTIKGISVTTTSGATSSPGVFSGIYLNVGSANIGTITGNTIGASTGTGSISVSSTSTGGISYGIVSDAAASAVIAISNNTIGSISTTGSTATVSHSLHAIDVTGAAATISIASNQIGSTSTANSLNASNASTSATGQIVTGINSSSSAATSITGNTISNLGNAYAPASSYTTASILRGIVTTSGVNTISNNTIKDMTTAANATGTGLAAGVIGIGQSSTSAGQVISSNTISNLGTTSSSASSVTGIIASGPTTGTNEIKTNNVNSLTASTTASTLNGIQVADAGNALIYNNIIRLGVNAAGSDLTADLIINGINQSNAASNHGIYFNSIYVGGAVSSSANNSFAINSAATSGNRIIRNNIFDNVRTNSSGSGKHYSVKLSGLTGLTINNNDYWTGASFLALNNATDATTLSAFQTATSQDGGSISVDPGFIAANGSESSFDLHITGGVSSALESGGANISGIAIDYDGQARPGPAGSTNGGGVTPDMGADEFDGIPGYTCATLSGLTAITSNATVCNNSAVLSITGAISGTGITYQWQVASSQTGSYSNISGATSSTYNVPTTSASNNWYQCVVTCLNGPVSATATAVNVIVQGCNYAVTRNTNVTYNSVITTGTGSTYSSLSSADDGYTNYVSLAGTTFKYRGQAVTQFFATSNGTMSFSSTQSTHTGYGDLTTSTAGKDQMLAPYWTDFVIKGNSLANKDASMRYKINGTLGSGTADIIIEWAEMEGYQFGNPNMNFQIILHENGNTIEYNYGNMLKFDGAANFTGTFATVCAIGLNGTTPATADLSQRLILQNANSTNFGTTSVINLLQTPECYSQLLFTPSATYSGGSAPATVPANNELAGAISLTVNSVPCTSNCGNSYYSLGATASTGTTLCSATTPGNADDDVWFTFTPSSSTANHKIVVTPTFAYDAVLQLIDLTSNTVVQCVNSSAAGLLETISSVTLDQTHQYALRIYDAGAGASGGGEFAVCVSEIIAPPTNDDPTGATALTIGSSCSGTSSEYPATLAATASASITACSATTAGTPDDDVWYKFTTNSNSGLTYTITATGVSTYNAVLQLFSGTPGSLTAVDCVNATGNGASETITSSTLAASTTYYLRVYHSGVGYATGNFSICVYATPPACVTSPTAPTNSSSICLSAGGTTLSWASVSNATKYDVYLDNTGGSSSLAVATNQTATSYTTPTALSAGTYTWRVVPKNDYGAATSCTNFTFTVSPTSVGGTASSDQTICSGSTPTALALTGNTGTIQWQSSTTSSTSGFTNISGGTNATLTLAALTATTYYRALVTSGVCTSATSNVVTITVNPTSVAGTVSANQAICSGNSPASITLSGSTGAIQWQSSSDNSTFADIIGATNSTLTAAQMGTLTTTTYYKAIVTSGVCSSATSSTVTVTVNALPTASISASGATTFCAGGNVVLTASTGTSYLWNNGATTQAITVTASGTYSVTVTNGNNCTATSSATTVVVNALPTVTATADQAVCSGSSAALSGSGASTYAWSNSETTASITVTPTSTTTYTVTGTDGNGCTNTANSTVTVNSLPSAPTASSTSLCGSGAVTLYASISGALTDWYASATGGSPLLQALGQYTTPTLTTTTSYYVESRDGATGCVSATRTAATVTINTPAVPSVTVVSSDEDNSICPNEAVTFTATATNGGSAPTYQWKLNGSNVTGTGSTYVNSSLVNSDVVTVVMTANNSCQSASTATSNSVTTVVNATPAALSVTGSTYCSYNNGVVNSTLGSISSTGSTSGITYTLFNGNDDPLSSIAGTGSVLTWTGVEAATGYYVIGVNNTTGCIGSTSSPAQVSVTSATIPLYTDTDGDNYGAGSISGYACVALAPSGYSLNTSDCNTTNSAINPGAVEICGNNIDENCSGNTDDIPGYFRSRESGNWGDATTWQFACSSTDTYQNSIYAPPANYMGYVNILNGHTVTVPANGVIYQTGILDIDNGGTLTLTGNPANAAPLNNNILPIAKLTVTVSVVNDGTMNIGHQASFVESSQTAANSGSGNFNVNLILTGTNNGTAPNGRYWYIGSPMNNTPANTFFDVQSMVRLWSYNATNNSWATVINSSTNTGANLTTALTPGIGYLYRAGSNKSYTFTGTAANLNNNLTTSTSFTGAGYKFVANPYTSYVDWKLVTRSGLNVSYWIRNSDNTAYEAFNATTSVSTSPSGQTTQFIPPMQGFYVYAFGTTGSLRIDNGDRVHSTNVLHAPLINQVVRLKLNNGVSSDYAVVYENELASNEFEETDTDKMFDYDFHQLYTLEGEHELSLNGLLNATAKGSVDMGIVVPNKGSYTIEASDLEIEEAVILEDKFNQTFQNLKLNPIYSFTTNAGTFNNRFVLHFTETETVGVGETESVADVVKVYNTSNKQVKVWVPNTEEYQGATVKVYDAIGNLVERKNMTSNELLLDLDIANGIYVVEVTGKTEVFSKKIFVGK